MFKKELQEDAKLEMRNLVFSILSNYAYGITKSELIHEEVIENAAKFGKEIISLLLGIIAQLKLENDIKS